MSIKKIGIIGFGNMGSAIAQRIKHKYKVFIFDKDYAKLNKISRINITRGTRELAHKTDAIILAIKPQDFETVLTEIKNYVQDKLIISIAAGITTKHIETKLGRVRVVRVMPNLGAKIGASVTCLSKGRFSSEDDLLSARAVFNNIGVVKVLNENKMDAVTAVSGSGPAYICYAIEKGINKDEFLAEFKNAAKAIGFTQKEAEFLVGNTFKCTIAVLKKKKISPAQLREQVTSKGGTTEAALEVLNRGDSLKSAVKAALRRAKQLAKG